MRQRVLAVVILAVVIRCASGTEAASFGRKHFVGSGSPAGHSISSQYADRQDADRQGHHPDIAFGVGY